jgi:hypothetical protein
MRLALPVGRSLVRCATGSLPSVLVSCTTPVLSRHCRDIFAPDDVTVCAFQDAPDKPSHVALGIFKAMVVRSP